MQGHEDLRIDLPELKLHIVKKIGGERSRRYFYYLGRFLNQKVSKSEFDKLCHRLLGKENLSLHNKLIHSILRNASLAQSSPAGHKSLVLGKEDGPEGSGSLIPNHNRNGHVWSNGVLPKVAVRDRPSPLGANGKVESLLLHQSHCRDDKNGNRNMENGGFGPFDYHRPGKVAAAVSRDESAPVVAPLGIQFCGASVGRARRTVQGLNRADFISCYDSGGLSDAEMLRKRMESIAVAHGLGGVSQECSSVLNNMLDVYLKKLIKSCVDLSGARSRNGSNSLQIHTSNQTYETMQEQRPVSLLDFRVAMELNPSQLGEDWPLLRERLLMRSFEEREGV
ncbi:unnamed protein product [Eruca vesicaria subsp. sativa]|uniref:Transcriptional regulator of RNA polII, SAGA, subunit n=1 Tax=Eruca vesicaria subsp. sativa TaxID=29727 RepID=A0ABC8LUG8_ERUVS|nr:unnamed protein product [Eruca vesicaria subsp. sativa]